MKLEFSRKEEYPQEKLFAKYVLQFANIIFSIGASTVMHYSL